MKKILAIYCLFLSISFVSGMDLHQAVEAGAYKTMERILYNKMTLTEYKEIESFLIEEIVKELDTYTIVRKSAERKRYSFEKFTMKASEKIKDTRDSFTKIKQIFRNNPIINSDDFSDVSSLILETIENHITALQAYSLQLTIAIDVGNLHSLQLNCINLEKIDDDILKACSNELDRYKADCINQLKNNETALYCACKYNKTAEAQLLLENGADPNLGCIKTGNTPLHIACYNGNLTLAELLLEHQADPHALASACLPNDKEQRIVSYSTLARACENTFQLKIIKLLFKHKVKPYNYENSLDPHSVLHSAWSRLYPNSITYHMNPHIIPPTLDIIKEITDQYDRFSNPYSVINALIGLLKACGREIKDRQDIYKPSCTYNLDTKSLCITLFSQSNPGAISITISQNNPHIAIKSYKQDVSFLYMGDYLEKKSKGKELELCHFEPAETPDQFLKNVKKCFKNNYWDNPKNEFYYLLVSPKLKQKFGDIKVNFA